MTLHVKNTIAIVTTQLVYALPKLATAFVIVYIAAWFVASAAMNQGGPALTWLPSVAGLISLLAYAAKQSMDSYLHSKDTQLELTKTNITCTISGFSTRTFSVPLNQVSSIHVEQGFIDRFFNVSRVVIVQIASTAAVYGFDYSDAVAFSKQFSSQQVKRKQP